MVVNEKYETQLYFWEGRRSNGPVAILEPEEKETLQELYWRIRHLEVRGAEKRLTHRSLDPIKALCDKLKNLGRKYWPSEATAQMALDILQERKEHAEGGKYSVSYEYAPMHHALSCGRIDLVEFLIRECGFRADSKRVLIRKYGICRGTGGNHAITFNDLIHEAYSNLEEPEQHRLTMERLLLLGVFPSGNVIKHHFLNEDGTYDTWRQSIRVLPGSKPNPSQWMSLKDACRRAILRSGRRIESKTMVDQLKLPQSLKTFLKFEDKEDYFCVSSG